MKLLSLDEALAKSQEAQYVKAVFPQSPKATFALGTQLLLWSSPAPCCGGSRSPTHLL